MAMTLEPPNLDLYLALLGDTLLDPGLQAPDPQRIGPDAQSLIPVPDFQRASDGSAQGRSGSGELSDKRTGSGRAPPIHSSFTAPSAEDASTRRKRPMNLKDEVAELEKQVAEQTAALQRLSVSNAFLSERVKMLELVIAVRDNQMKRCQSIKEGLLFNPVCPDRLPEIPPEQLEQPVPSFVATVQLAVCSHTANMLSSVVADLHRYPYLRIGPEPGATWPRYKTLVGRSGEPASPMPERLLAPQPGISNQSGQDVQAAAEIAPEGTVATLRQVLDKVDAWTTALMHWCFTHPQVVPSSVNLQHALSSPHPDWPALLASIATNVEASEQGSSHTIAPESHWTQVLRIVSLTPHQLLQCAVLYDIFSQCKAAVATQRVTLAATLQRMQQKRPYNGTVATDADAAASCVEKSAEVVMEEAGILKRLQEGLIKERCLIILAAETFWNHILTPVQVALYLANCFPFFPDEVALLQAAAKEYHRQTTSRSTV